MRVFNQASPAARAALIYITIGSLTVIWTCVWFVYLRNHPPDGNLVYYWCTGLLITGLTLIVIGLGLGRIGRAARHADLPAATVVPSLDVRPKEEVAVPVETVPDASPPLTGPDIQVAVAPPPATLVRQSGVAAVPVRKLS